MRKSAWVILMVIAIVSANAENWPQWRGASFNGSSTETGLPSEWSKTENVAWSVTLPGPSAASPVIWDDQVFVSSTDLTNQSLLAICLERKTGQILWQQKVAEGIRRDRQSTYSASSPVTDGKRAVFFYSTGDMVAFDFKGTKLWSQNIQTNYGPFAFLWTFSSSPVLYQDKLYLQVLQRNVPVNGRGQPDGPNDSYLLALDVATGKILWRVIRPSEAIAESRESFATPVPFSFQGRAELLVTGGDCLTGHDFATGKELWRWETWNPGRIGHWRQVVTPVTGNAAILACAPKGSPVYAIQVGGSGKLGETAILWKSDQQKMVSSDVPTPLFYQGDFFVLNDLRKCLSRVDSATGKVKWTIDTPGRAKYEASPTGADGKVYLMNFKGEVSIVNADTGAVLRTIPMGEEDDDMIRSTIAVARRQLFIRTNQKLFCIGRD